MFSDPLENKILTLSTVLAFIYGTRCETNKTFWLKKIKVASTALLVVDSIGTRESVFTASLLAHCVGDYLIEHHSILTAIPVFLVGHLLYITQLKNQLIAHHELDFTHAFLLLGVGIYSAGMTKLLSQHCKGVLKKAVMVYCAVLALLLATCVLQKNNMIGLFLSATLYIASDSLIGINHFVCKIPRANYFTWGLYYVGQRCLMDAFSNINLNPKPVF